MLNTFAACKASYISVYFQISLWLCDKYVSTRPPIHSRDSSSSSLSPIVLQETNSVGLGIVYSTRRK